MKKLISALLACIMMLTTLTVAAGAVSIKDGTVALNALFEDWECYDQDTGDVLTDGVFYSPVTDKSDTKKYPLFIWLHGMTSGGEKRLQLNYHLSNFASEEYQDRYGDGGFFVFAPRAIHGKDWNPSYYATLKSIIDIFVQEKGKNIDTDRIYIGGYSTGGGMVWDMLESYPKYFAAALIAAPATEPTDMSDRALSRMCNVPIWVFSCDNDDTGFAGTDDVRSIFNSLVRLSQNKGNLRMTNFTSASNADYSRRDDPIIGTCADHYIWECITFDMHMIDGTTPYINGTTVDGNGNTIIFDSDPSNGVISWLKQFVRDENRVTAMAGQTFWEKIADFFNDFFAKIKAFFESMF